MRTLSTPYSCVQPQQWDTGQQYWLTLPHWLKVGLWKFRVLLNAYSFSVADLSAPQSLSVMIVDGDSQSVSVTWMKPTSGSVYDYVVVYYPYGRPELQKSLSVQSTSVILSRLTPSTLYKFLVHANDASNPPAVSFVLIPAIGNWKRFCTSVSVSK